MPTILVADDNSNIQKMVSLVFKEKGIRVVAVGNGEAACRKVPEVQPDVVLADVFMPVRNGYEVCEFVKQDPQFAETPVILLVGAFDPLDEKEAQRVGANGVLKKPFVPPEPLIAMVSSLLKIEPPAEEPQPVQTTGDSLIPESPLESGPTARQMAIAQAQAQYANAETDETVTTFSAPVAIPASQAAQEAEPEDDSEPGSEWSRRRATMDYEIDSADSAHMVEKLAAENTAEEPEILASNKHLPFGGANLPEMQSGPAAKSSAAKWADLTAPETAIEPVVETSASESTAPEITVPIEAASPAMGFEDTSRPHESAIGGWPSQLMPADEITAQALPAEPEAVPAATTSWNVVPVPNEPVAQTRDAVSEAASASWPLPHADVEPEETILHTGAIEESRQPPAPRQSSEEKPVWEATPEPPLALPEAASYEMPVQAETAAEAVAPALEEVAPALETPAEKPSAKAPIDQATVDDVVARVISKLEPHLHQALANGILRPLVEEVLSQRDKK